MNRGDKGENIFYVPKYKEYFVRIMNAYAEKFGMEIIGYVIMNNHYHILLKNCSGMLSKYMMIINMKYALYYRKKEGGKGYVFQNRFKSTIIENVEYLRDCLIYLYLNPVRKEIVEDPFTYRWSSLYNIVNKPPLDSTQKNLIYLFSSIDNFIACLKERNGKLLKVRKYRNITYIGSDGFILNSLKIYNRRRNNDFILSPKRRIEDQNPISLEQIFNDVLKKFKINLRKTSSYETNKQTIHKILFYLRDTYDMKYSDISRIKLFSRYTYKSLTSTYHRLKSSKINGL
ncbi:MAG: transposase [bacterium]|nr:transposase [bacterium]